MKISSKVHSMFSVQHVIGNVRGVGMFVGVDIVKDPETREADSDVARHIVTRLKEERILLQTDGPHDNVLKFKSPLAFQIDDANR